MFSIIIFSSIYMVLFSFFPMLYIGHFTFSSLDTFINILSILWCFLGTQCLDSLFSDTLIYAFILNNIL